MDWLRKQEQVPYVKDILTIDEGLGLDKRSWSYIGYKGGAEPGVLNFTLLLQNSKKEWFAFAMTWHNPSQDVNLSQMVTLAERLLRSASKQ
jgi:hypothetical protein